MSEVVSNNYTEEDDVLCEIATIGLFPTGQDTYKLYVHGDSYNGRQATPHLHICSMNDAHFDLELSLEDLLVHDKWVRLRVRDYWDDQQIDDKEKTEDWFPYTNLLEMVQDFLFEEGYEVGECNYISPLHYAIVSWNKEFDFSAYRRKENPLLDVLKKKGLNILPKYRKYFEDKTDS